MHGAKHIFLTGEIQSGKSTLIAAVLSRHPDWRIGGFVTRTALAGGGETGRGVYLLPAGEPDACQDSGNLVGIRLGCGVRTALPEVFDRVGVDILMRAPPADLIVMDELGTMENLALVFQAQVRSVLEGDKPVLGVIKKKDTPFLQSIRQREDVRILDVHIPAFEDCLRQADAFLCRLVIPSLSADKNLVE